MNVYKRPLFRQMGGPAQVMPQDIMAAGQQEGAAAGQILQQSEQAMAQQMQGVGEEYAQEMMGGLDNAENFKQVIDSIRGNEMPIQNRYQELAQYVGSEDAQQTPESVLAMVQPTLMMTEEGAMNSGIGDLMREISDQVDMELPTGEPTQMGQGLGSLMAAGQPVQEFNRGGAVQRFNVGGQALAAPTFQGLPQLDSQLQQAYTDRLGVYQQALGRDPQREREQMQSDILFDIAGRGLAFASGVDPQTGENIAGRPMGAQLARQVQTLPGTISERLMQQREREEGIKLAALQSAEKGEEARIAQMGRERLQGMQSAVNFATQIADQDFKRAEGQSARAHESALVDRRGEIQTALQNLQGSQQIDQIEARGQLQKQLAELNSELTATRDQALHENNLETLGVRQDYEIEQMDKAYEQKSALQGTQLAAQAEQNALDRALKEAMQNQELGVRQAMQQAQMENQRELQELDQQWRSSENGIDREFRLEIVQRQERQAQIDRELRMAMQENDIDAQKALQNERLANARELQELRQEWASSESGLDRELKVDIIDRQIQQQVFDRIQNQNQFESTAQLEAYSLAIKDRMAEYTRLGSSFDARIAQVVTTPDFYNGYASGSLDEENNTLFEMSVLQYTAPETVFDPKTQTYVRKPGKKLPPRVMEAVESGNPELAQMINQNLGISGRGAGDQQAGEAGEQPTAYAERYPNRAQLGLPEPPPGIEVPDINPSGLTTKNIDYSSAFGPMAAIDNIANTVSDLFGGELAAPETEQARNYFVALREKLIGLADASIEGRPSNFQIEIQQSLLPDVGSILNGDEAAVEKIDKLIDKVGSELTQKAQSFDMGGLSEDKAQDIRRQYNYISYILAELNEVKRGMSATVQTDRPAVESFIKPAQ